LPYDQIWFGQGFAVTSVLARIDPAGRLSIPARHRKALGLEAGGPVVVALEGKEVRVRAVADVMAELQAETARLLAGPDASVDAFLAERRAEAAREEAGTGGDPPSGRPPMAGQDGDKGDGGR
jgi:AbrB family looped-hinge helix DNA binding protein